MVLSRLQSGFLKGVADGLSPVFRQQQVSAGYWLDFEGWCRDCLGVGITEYQADLGSLIASQGVRVAVAAGHGVGKSALAAMLILWWVDTRMGGGVGRPERVSVLTIAPTFPQVNGVIWKEVRTWFRVYNERVAEGARIRGRGGDSGFLPVRKLQGVVSDADPVWKIRGITVAQGRAPQTIESLQGQHAEYVLAIADEAVSIANNDAAIKMLDNVASNKASVVVQFANPTDPVSFMGKVFSHVPGEAARRGLEDSVKALGLVGVDTGSGVERGFEGSVRDYLAPFQDSDGLGWGKVFDPVQNYWCYGISVFSSPNFHGGGLCECVEHEGKPAGLGFSESALGALTNQDYVRNFIQRTGGDLNNPEYLSRVRGLFVYNADNTVFGWDSVAPCTASPVYGGLLKNDVLIPAASLRRLILGVDLSRSKAGDLNSVYACVGEPDGVRIVSFVDSWNSHDSNLTVEHIAYLARVLGAVEVRLDAGGLGGPVYDAVVDTLTGSGIVCFGANFGGRPSFGERFFNKRAEWFSYLKDELEYERLFIGADYPDGEDVFDRFSVRYPDVSQKSAAGIGEGGLIVANELMSLRVKRHAPFTLVSKDEMRKNGVASPDHADALALACVDLGRDYDRLRFQADNNKIVDVEFDLSDSINSFTSMEGGVTFGVI